MTTLHIDPTLSVAELARGVRGAARVFEQLGIDYCCRGRQPLRTVVAELSLGLDDVLAALRAEAHEGAAPPEFRDAAALISHIVQRHHKYTRDALARLQPLAAKVLRVHGDSHPELERVAELLALLSADLLPHMLREERVLFPYIASLAHGKSEPPPFGSAANPIRVMHTEHEHVGALLEALAVATNHYCPPPGACGSFGALYAGAKELQADIHQHVHLENHLLFPMALELERQSGARRAEADA